MQADKTYKCNNKLHSVEYTLTSHASYSSFRRFEGKDIIYILRGLLLCNGYIGLRQNRYVGNRTVSAER